ncbi:MAG: hypothetical protein H8D63_01195 [Parcubacteria group bacterium]|nr:hypothetical protein [Parcubacteria group bacterium]
MRATFLKRGDEKIADRKGNVLVAFVVLSLSSFFILGSAVFSGVKKGSENGDVFVDPDVLGLGSTSPLSGRM